MKHRKTTSISALLMTSFFVSSLSSCVSQNGLGFWKEEAEAAIVESETVSPLTVKDMADYLQTRKEHYPLSDEFIERYQQTSGGYIAYAKQLGVLVDKEQHEPNQKWHFFTSWLDQSLADGTITYEADAKQRIYTGLLCPELLLWIYEACEVNPAKVRQAKEVAEAGKVAGTNVSTIAKNMRGCVPWEDLEVTVRNAMEDPLISGVPSGIDLSLNATKKLNPVIKEGSGAISYKSKDVSIASIDSNGTITANKLGETDIVISCENEIEASKNVHIVVAEHGSEDNPISVEEALSIASKVCLEKDETTNETIYAHGVAKTTADEKGNFSLSSSLGEMLVAASTNKEGVALIAENDQVSLAGFIKKTASSLQYEEAEVFRNERGISTITLKKNGNVSVKVGDDVFTESKTATNGEVFSFSVEPIGEAVVQKVLVAGKEISSDEGVYSFEVKGNAEISVVTQGPTPIGSLAKYNISYDLGTRKTAKAYASADEVLYSFAKEEGVDLLSSCDSFDLMYGGANGGSGDTAWYTGNVMKFGSTSSNGYITLSLTAPVNRVILTGYVYSSTCDVRIGDDSSLDWGDSSTDGKTTKNRLSSMTVANKENVEAGSTSSVTVDFEQTQTLRIATTNKKPLFLTAIEFVLHGEE